MDENQRAEFNRQEAARQAQAEINHHERYCPNCSGVSPMGGLCSSCQAALKDAEPGGDADWIVDHERYCPNCSGVSPMGGLCSSCQAALRAAERGLEEESFTTSPPDEGFGTDNDPRYHDRGNVEMPPDHHIFPEVFREKFEKAGIDIDMYAVTLYQFQHDVVHSEGWNSDWNMFFEMFDEGDVSPDVDDVMDFGVYMIEKYDLGDAIPHPYLDKSGELGPHLF